MRASIMNDVGVLLGLLEKINKRGRDLMSCDLIGYNILLVKLDVWKARFFSVRRTRLNVENLEGHHELPSPPTSNVQKPSPPAILRLSQNNTPTPCSPQIDSPVILVRARANLQTPSHTFHHPYQVPIIWDAQRLITTRTRPRDCVIKSRPLLASSSAARERRTS